LGSKKLQRSTGNGEASPFQKQFLIEEEINSGVESLNDDIISEAIDYSITMTM